MKNTANFLNYELKTLKKNIEVSGDPLGFKKIYWTDWTKDLEIPEPGKSLFFTGRMYQMLPYIRQTTQMLPLIQPLVSKWPTRHLIDFGNKLAGELLIRKKAAVDEEFNSRCNNIVKGIFYSLQNLGEKVGYLFEKEPYTGVLLYDLGLVKQVTPHVKQVASFFVSQGFEKIITLDPHSTFMLKEIYPELAQDFNIQVKNYIEILANREPGINISSRENIPDNFVIHDSCYMSRELGIIENIRTILDKLNLKYYESQNCGRDTACCGGPVEYAFPGLSHNIAKSRIKELREKSRNILVTCPICYLNFVNHESSQDVRIWDLGEVLYHMVSGHAGT
ncbi:MAG: heterodisulfide reductase-related iron-sulfur binding cluster [Bacteroidota bacterium]